MKQYLFFAIAAVIPAFVFATPAPIVATLNALDMDGAVHSNLSNRSFVGLDLTGLYLKNQIVEWTDFTNCTGISGTDLSTAMILMGSKLGGSNLNLTGLVIPHGYCYGIDLSATGSGGATTTLNVSALNACTTLSRSNLSGLNLTGLNLTGINVMYVNFTNCTNFTAAMLAKSTSISYCNVTGTGITRAALQSALQSSWAGNATLINSISTVLGTITGLQ